MSPVKLINQRVTAENDFGGIYGGVVKAVTPAGRVLVDCDEVDLGYGWEPADGVRSFRLEQVRGVEEEEDIESH